MLCIVVSSDSPVNRPAGLQVQSSLPPACFQSSAVFHAAGVSPAVQSSSCFRHPAQRSPPGFRQLSRRPTSVRPQASRLTVPRPGSGHYPAAQHSSGLRLIRPAARHFFLIVSVRQPAASRRLRLFIDLIIIAHMCPQCRTSPVNNTTLTGQAEPARTCCRRSAVPTATCCRASYRRPLAAIHWSGQGLRIRKIPCGLSGRRRPPRLGEAPLRAPPDPLRSLSGRAG